MSNMHALFTDPANNRAVLSAPGPAEAKTLSSVAGSSTVAPGAEADVELNFPAWRGVQL